MRLSTMANATKHSCLNCNRTVAGDYCAKCGQSIKIGKLDTDWMVENLSEVALHLRKNKLLRTFSMMLLDPGKVVFEYIAGHRIIYHPPLNYLVLSALVYKLLSEWILRKNGWESGRFAEMTPLHLLLSFGAISIAAYILILRPHFSIIETVVAVCYIYGTVFLIAPVLAIIIQAPFPRIADSLKPVYRPFIVDGWTIVFAIYMAVRITLKAQVSLLRLAIVTLFTFSLYYLQEIDLAWWHKVGNHFLM